MIFPLVLVDEIISAGLSKPESKTKGSPVKLPKYSYPIIRGDEQFNEILRFINEKAARK